MNKNNDKELNGQAYENYDAVEPIERRFEVNSWSECVHPDHHLRDEKAEKDEFGII